MQIPLALDNEEKGEALDYTLNNAKKFVVDGKSEITTNATVICHYDFEGKIIFDHSNKC